MDLIVGLYDAEYALITYDDSSYYLSDGISFPPETDEDYEALAENYVYDYIAAQAPGDANYVGFVEIADGDKTVCMIAEIRNGEVVNWYDDSSEEDMEALASLGVVI